MTSSSIVDIADRKSRLRAVLFMTASLIFLLVQLITRPPFSAYGHGWRLHAWVVNALFLLLCLATGGGLVGDPRIRALMNDEVSRHHYRSASAWGFWIAALSGMILYVAPPFRGFTGMQTSWIIVTAATSGALVVFSWLELRSHADA